VNREDRGGTVFVKSHANTKWAWGEMFGKYKSGRMGNGAKSQEDIAGFLCLQKGGGRPPWPHASTVEGLEGRGGCGKTEQNL